MDMSAVPKPHALFARMRAAQSTRLPDIPALLAVLAAQQSASLTAKRVREGNPPDFVGDEPARMAVIFAPAAQDQAAFSGASGSFNSGVASRLSMGSDGESDVYSGV